MPKVLIIEDDVDGSRSVEEAVREAGFDTVTAADGRSGVEAFRSDNFDTVLSDLVLPDIDGIEALKSILNINPNVPVLIMTAYGTVSSSVNALKAGAYDYILKPLDLDELQTKVARAIETSKLRSEVTDLKATLHNRYSLRSMVATSKPMAEIIKQIEAAANSNATVLILGESGTGKELVARALHAESPRQHGPFVAVNCGAFSESLLSSELFGHEKGAFTGATNQHTGAFERASGGTLFLDEIGVAPIAVQIKLLRVLEEKEVTRVGGREPIRIDTRIISATNMDLDDLVKENKFRHDLLYRLKVVTIKLPPLRERLDDIRPMADRFMTAACEEHGRHIEAIDPDCYAILEKYRWPGNVRQLRNVIESAVVMASSHILKPEDIKLEDTDKNTEPEFLAPAGMPLAEIEKHAILASLRRNKGNQSLAAEELGVSQRTIQRKIKEYEFPF